MRSQRLIALKNQIRDEILDGYVKRGEPLSVVMERAGNDGCYTSHADSFVEVRVHVPDDVSNLHGEIVEAIPLSHENGVILAELKC